MTDQERWDVATTAAYLVVQPKTVTGYSARGEMPEPDGHLGRTPWWHPATIQVWAAARPRSPAPRTSATTQEDPHD